MKILFVQADNQDRARISDWFRFSRQEIAAVSTRDEVQEHVAGCDVVLIDPDDLPREMGSELISNLREEGLLTPICIIVHEDTYIVNEDAWRLRAEALDAGADHYVTKPFYLKELLATLRKLTAPQTDD